MKEEPFVKGALILADALYIFYQSEKNHSESFKILRLKDNLQLALIRSLEENCGKLQE